jgi:alanine dehydrogenase
MVIGGGVVGRNAAEVTIGMGAEVYVLNRNIDRLRELEFVLNNRASTVYASDAGRRAAPAGGSISSSARGPRPRANAPRLVTRGQLSLGRIGARKVAFGAGSVHERSKVSHRDLTSRAVRGFFDAGGGTRTPDTRIMIPLL